MSPDTITVLREAGETWQRIADALNGDRVPTARGRTAWRPSSVRSAWLTRERELAAHAR
jgi:hypothetical protein